MKILICGIGAIGSNLAALLACDLRGEHEITILDFDTVEERNVRAGTQFYMPDQIGMKKTEALQYNIYKWFERDIKIVNQNIKDYMVMGQSHDLVIDCFDNEEARKHVQETWKFFPKVMRAGLPFKLLHVGFSDQFTFAIEWADNYTVPTDITSGFDVCEALGAASFVKMVASLAGTVVCEYIEKGTKNELIGNRLKITKVN